MFRKGWPAVYKDRRLESCAVDTRELAKKKVEALMKLYGDKSRAIVKVDWFMRNKGHLFIAENQDLEEEQFMIVRIGNEPYGIKIKDVIKILKILLGYCIITRKSGADTDKPGNNHCCHA